MNRRVERRPNREELARRRSWARLVADLESRLAEVLRGFVSSDLIALHARCEDELSRVHVAIQARLLRHAAELCLLRDANARLWTAAAAAPNFADWRRAADEEIQLALSDGRRIDGNLLACQLMPRDAWPPAEVLARAARRLSPGPTSELLFARSRFAAGHRREAEARYRAIVRGGRMLGGRVHEAAAAAAEARGDLRAALESNLVARALGAGPRAEAAAFVIACVLGERSVALQLADELDAREAERRSAPREHARMLRELAARWRARDIAPRPAPGTVALVADCLCSGERGLADLCYALLS
ncbi:MAG: hypothetical protein H6831_09845 [Planctomycetes bacterium]|nr:hypothetical protein [Planctomycetota bacterium]